MFISEQKLLLDRPAVPCKLLHDYNKKAKSPYKVNKTKSPYKGGLVVLLIDPDSDTLNYCSFNAI